ncbi:MAG TPA: phosphodiester glycosidase family protein [Armatimonadota bacterium]|nr:phosphodiester glycosidase family protein [Armatimonadota bacterium]
MKNNDCRIYRWLTVVFVLLLLSVCKVNAQSVTYQVRAVHSTRVHVVYVDLKDSSLFVTPAIAYNRLGRRQSFSSFQSVYRPLAQITGVYFGFADSLPVGDIVINGHAYYDGAVGSALAITHGNYATIIDVPYHQRRTWSGYQSVLQGGIRLVRNGRRSLSPHSQGFHDPGLFQRAPRTAVGITSSNKLLLVASSRGQTLSELADVMRSLGCRDAMSLDGGGSTGLAYRGRVIIAPGRSLSNVLMVTRRH